MNSILDQTLTNSIKEDPEGNFYPDFDQLKKDLKSLMLEILGSDEEIRYEDDTTYGDTSFRHQDVVWGQNELRAELRQRIGEL